MIETISHITIIVRDIEKTGHFLQTIFDAKEVYDSSQKNFSLSYEKFFVVGGVWMAVMEGSPISERSYNHIAFRIPDSEFDEYVSRIKKLGVEIRPGRDRVGGEARSIYFYDYDNHLFELHTGTLDDRLACYSNG
ncbi:MAG: FosX/FosE/FosI family fosfomycin resistance thiol transferase [Candidatus Brocadiae bacterium]|nr:FosX/FosE/FosI family fosfomycin resistance thiol transferase [Candidatus Brocadiia bacterium]